MRIVFLVAFLCPLLLGLGSAAKAEILPQAPAPAKIPLESPAPPVKQIGDLRASTPKPKLSLADAEARALEHQPALMAQRLRQQAAGKAEAKERSAYFPQLYGNLTGVQSNGDTAVAAGNVTTSSISTRLAGGFTLLQMITDFGRTNARVRSAKLAALASEQTTESFRQQVLRDVDDAYFSLQAAESVQRTAQAVLNFRKVSLKQLTALERSQLRSTLDVQFAQVLVSEAQLALFRADSTVRIARAQLAASMGDEEDPEYVLVDEPLPTSPGSDVEIYIKKALDTRPDLRARGLQAESAHQFAHAQEKLMYPTVNAIGTAGEVPTHGPTLQDQYGAIGINLNVPVFNGGRYSNMAQEAQLRAKAEDEDVVHLKVQIARDVKANWAKTRDAFLEIQVAQSLVSQTKEAMRLAQARYDAGLGSIVELNEAELNQTSALITAATARFDYQRAYEQFNYTIGTIH